MKGVQRFALVLAGVLVPAALLLAGCSPADPTQPSPTMEATATVAAGALDDADAIVAAQEQVLSRIHDAVLPSVVSIRVGQSAVSGGEGSGFVWDDAGHVVTNRHVVEGVDRVSVVFADRTVMGAVVLGTDPDSDLAVLKLEGDTSHLRPVSLGDSSAVAPGQMAVAIGNPFGQEFTMTSGIVSAVGRTIRSGNSDFSIPRVIQTDASINPGNSGGPLLDRRGRVIGVNTQIISRSGSSAGIGFAVPIDLAKRVVPVLLSEGAYEYAWLGISGVDLSATMAERMEIPPDARGALVATVFPDSPAEAAGLRGSRETVVADGGHVPLGGDVIVAVDGAPIHSMDDLIAYLVENTSPGDSVVLDVLREKGEEVTLEVTLGKRPSL